MTVSAHTEKHLVAEKVVFGACVRFRLRTKLDLYRAVVIKDFPSEPKNSHKGTDQLGYIFILKGQVLGDELRFFYILLCNVTSGYGLI